ncbi:sce7726 family protein [Mycobacterium mantenii]|uniref:sce7726 family protein n=1 Tax=Mycobacterium mantenii TaxID=560555 RepID=UPI001153F319|nr:sce7726 family protein [Mycobacterium mantenii]
MRDHDVRVALRNHLVVEHANDSSTRVMEELGLCEEVRVDFAVINGAFTGFELKSERDTLARLPRQEATYSRVFDYVYLVAAGNHIDRAQQLIPSWWGIVTALPTTTSGVSLRFDRVAIENPTVDASAVVQLLWRDEALAILARMGADRGVRSKPRAEVWERLIETLNVADLRSEVREVLKARPGWRENPKRRGSVVTSRLSGTTPRFLARRIH